MVNMTITCSLQKQYIFLHDALVEYIQCGDTSYSCGGFEKTLTTLCAPGHGGVSELETQFKVITHAYTIQELHLLTLNILISSITPLNAGQCYFTFEYDGVSV